MYINKIRNKQFSFRKWQNKKYAIFNSLGRLIKICTISAAYLFVIMPAKANEDKDTVLVFYQNTDIEEVSISGNRIPLLEEEQARIVNVVKATQLASSPAGSINDQLDQVPGVDMRTRGPLGVQSDISIRGGNFKQATVLLNGVKITDAQTGHNSLNLPIDLNSINRIELIKGPSSRVFGANAFNGAVNIVAQPGFSDYFIVGLAAGQNGYNKLNANINKNIGKSRHLLSLSNSSSSGYIYNTDFSIFNLFYNSIINSENGDLSMQAGYQNKGAGAQNFYTTAFPTQFEQTRTKFASISYNTKIQSIEIKPRFYIRRGHDRFELYREGENYYNNIDSLGIWVNHETNDTAMSFYKGHNYHMNTVTGFETDFTYKSKLGTTNIGFEYRNEFIVSNKIGVNADTIDAPGEEDGIFTKELRREIQSVYLEHSTSISNLSFNGGMLIQKSSDYNTQLFPGIDVRYNFSPKYAVFVNWNSATRLPTFTELYYNTSTHKGNVDLELENTQSTEAGVMFKRKAFSGYFSLYYTMGTNLIDWVQDTNNLVLNTSGNPMWESKNISESNTIGFEGQININLKEINKDIAILNSFSLSYAYLNREISSGAYISSYSLDYMKNKLNVGFNSSYRKLYFTLLASYLDRNDYFNYISNQEVIFDPYVLVDAKLAYRNDKLEIFIDANNIFNTKYINYIGLEMPGRWIRFGISRRMNL